MLEKKAEFINSSFRGVGLMAEYVAPRDSIHVGIVIRDDTSLTLYHFMRTNQIEKAEILNNAKCDNLYFVGLKNFHQSLIPSLIPLLDDVSGKKLLNNLYLNVESVYYKDGRFDIGSGFYLTKEDIERTINCAVFVMTVLKAFFHETIEFATWPQADPSKRKYLEDWLDAMSIKGIDRDAYYAFCKEIRGKHIFTSPYTTSNPSIYSENEPKSEELLKLIRVGATS